jgi:hypothetical protein
MMQEDTLTAILRKLGVRVAKRNRNGWLDFTCPLAPWTHQHGHDSSPSAGAKVNPTGRSAWHCFTCKQHGSMASLVRQIETYSGKRFPGLIREADLADTMPMFAADYGSFEMPLEVEPAPEPIEEAAVDGLYPAAWEAPRAQGYLEARGVGQGTAETLGLLYDDGLSDPRRPDAPRVLFPVRGLDGRLYGFTGRALTPDAKPKVRDYYGLPKRHLILGAERWQAGRPVVIVEGLFAYARLIELGVEDRVNVGALLGSVLTPEKADLLRHFDQSVYLLLDNDKAGDDGIFGTLKPDGSRDEARGAIAQLVEHVPVLIPEWPEGKDDPDQLSRAEVDAMLDETQPYSPPRKKRLTKNR